MRVFAGLCAAVAAAVLVSLLAGHRPARNRRGETLRRRLTSGTRVPRATWLQQADVNLTPAQFWGLGACAGGITFVLTAAVTRAPLVAIAPATAAAASHPPVVMIVFDALCS